MTKEPLGLYLLRLIVACGLFAFMAMLYWSSLALEERTRTIQNKLEQVDNQLQDLKDTLATQPVAAPSAPIQENETVAAAESKYPNLLQPDPFYEKTLPGMLPPNFKPQGSFHSGTIGKPETLHPFSMWAQVSDWIGMCNISAARLQFGFYDRYAPDGALRIEQRMREDKGVPEFWVFLRKNAFWQPLSKDWFSEDIALAPMFLKKHPVTAGDFKLYFDAVLNPYNQDPKATSLRNFYGDLEEIKVIDDYTFVVRWKAHDIEENGKKIPKIKFMAKSLTMGLTPLAGFVFKHFADGSKIVEEDLDPDTYLNSSVWAQNLSRHWAKNIIPSCGAWLFRGMSDSQIAFERNKQFYLPLEVLVQGSEIQFKDSTDAVWQEFKANKYELYHLQPDKVLELEQFLQTDMYKKQAATGSAIKRLDYLSRSYAYIGWNQAKPYFKSKKVRQALTMAIDRQRIILDYLHGMGEEITGSFYKYSPSTDLSIKPLPYDPRQAKQMLEQEGWFDSDGDGVIDKVIDGVKVPFKFQLTYYVKNNVSKSITEYVATALKEVGIVVELHGVDTADLSATFEDKSFDALYLAWALGVPPEDPRQLWSSEGADEKGSSNAIGFKNKEVDQIISQLDYEYNETKRKELYYRFDKILYDEQPYTFLYGPKAALLYREFVQNVFIPADRQDIIPGAQVTVPDGSIYWLKRP